MNSTRRGVLLGILAFAPLAAAAVAAEAASEKISGVFPDGTPWQAVKPANWNGTLLLDLDAVRPNMPPPPANMPAPPPGPPPSGFQDWVLAQGFGVGGIAREPIGYEFLRAVDLLIEVRRLFAAKWSAPKRTLALGGSRGAFVARLAVERHPEVFDGALFSAGGGGGQIAGLHDRLNALFTLKTLVDPNAPLQLVGITNVPAEQAAVAALVAKANATPQGRARLALAAAFEQFALWSSRAKPRSAPGDYDAQVDQIAESFAFGNPPSVRAGVEKVAGGNVSWNTGVDYADLLKRSGRQAMVEALYRKAGLDLKADLDVLGRAPRISADSKAVAKIERITTYTGRIKGPVVEVDNDDPVDAASYKLAYRETLRRAGTEKDFRLLWADGAGHGGQTQLDRAVGFRLLIRRLDTGAWGDTSLPALKAMAADIARTSPVNLGRSTLFDPGAIPAPLFTWDAHNWGSYKP